MRMRIAAIIANLQRHLRCVALLLGPVIFRKSAPARLGLVLQTRLRKMELHVAMDFSAPLANVLHEISSVSM